MTVRNGREFLSIPGPTNVPEEVLQAMHRPAIDIYAGTLVDTTDSCLEDLRHVFRTQGSTYIYAANGHGAWEGALANVMSRNETVLVLASGRFATAWGMMAEKMGIKVQVLEQDYRYAVDPAAVEARLKEDRNGEIKAILVVQIDTASGVVNDIAAIRQAIDAAGHHALLMVDTIASLGTMPFEMDAWGVDVAVAGAQKGLMMTPGLSFIAANDKAKAIHQTADLCTQYWDWTARDGSIHYQKYCGTPPEHMLFGLRKALDMIKEEGLENIFQRHRILAQAVHQAVEIWAQGNALAFNVVEPQARAVSVTPVITTDGSDPRPLLDYCEHKCGVVVGIGIGDLDNKAIRIAHMGYVNAPMIMGTLSIIETGLKALGIRHGSGGVQAAIDHLAEAVPA